MAAVSQTVFDGIVTERDRLRDEVVYYTDQIRYAREAIASHESFIARDTEIADGLDAVIADLTVSV